jgi:hypothetical protein
MGFPLYKIYAVEKKLKEKNVIFVFARVDYLHYKSQKTTKGEFIKGGAASARFSTPDNATDMALWCMFVPGQQNDEVTLKPDHVLMHNSLEVADRERLWKIANKNDLLHFLLSVLAPTSLINQVAES